MDVVTGAALVIAIGCARETAEPHIWTLERAGQHVETSQPAVTEAEKAKLGASALGSSTYRLIGVADFVDAETSRKIAARGAILAAGRVNATGALAPGRKVAVKGLYIDGRPARINLTSVADLGSCVLFPGAAVQGGRSASDGVYTQAQQKRGEEIYTRECSTCHGATMRGGEGSPGLTGADFAASWNAKTVADLFDKIRETMPAPPEQPGKLSPQQNADVVAHILSGNGFAAGPAELPPDVAQLGKIRITVKP